MSKQPFPLAVPNVKAHIIKAIVVGYVLGWLCIGLPIALVWLCISLVYDLNFGISLVYILTLPVWAVVQGFFIALLVHVGLSLYQYLTRKSRAPQVPAA